MTLQPINYYIDWLLWPMWHLLLISCMILKDNRVKFQPRIRWIWSCFPRNIYAANFPHIDHCKVVSDGICKQETMLKKQRTVMKRPIRMEAKDHSKRQRWKHKKNKQWTLNFCVWDVTYPHMQHLTPPRYYIYCKEPMCWQDKTIYSSRWKC